MTVGSKDAVKSMENSTRVLAADKRRSLPPTDARAERRQLTVLFCDVVGSTTLSVRLDPEDLREILHKFQTRSSEAIRRYDGHVARFLGDGILAYFGYPQAHEDDVERAVHAALDMIGTITAITTPSGQHIEVRIGIATGRVIVGDLIGEEPEREFAIVGEAPNVASRLQQIAKPNQILVAPHTRRLLGGLFELEDLGEREIKGLDQQIRIWRVLGPKALETRFEGRRSSHLTPFTGRDAELSTLRRCFQMAERGSGQAVMISGEPGIGKSRLIAALRTELIHQDHDLLYFQCSSFHTVSAWYPVIRHLEEAAGITHDLAPTLRLEKLEQLVRYHMTETSSNVPLFASLLSLPLEGRYPPLDFTPEQLKNRTFSALLDLLSARARRQTLLLVFEDVHWIDPTSVELIQRLMARVPHSPMLAIMSFRPGFTVPWLHQLGFTRLEIQRLARADVTTMISSLTASDTLPQPMVEQIIERTDGVPFFVEEVTKAVLETRKSGLGEATPAVPPTLHDSLMARLDQIPSMKIAAQGAAAIGREFSLDLLQAVTPLSPGHLRAAIRSLLASGLVYRHGATANRTYAFAHALVQEEALASLLRTDRQDLDLAIAEALSTRFASATENSPEVIAHHFTRAGKSRSAIHYWLKAAQRSIGRSAFSEANAHLRLALDLLSDLPAQPDRDQLELQIQQSLGSVLAASKGFGAAETMSAFRRALDLCGQLPDSPMVFSVLNGMISMHVARGEFENSRDVAEDLLRRASRHQDPTPRLMGHRGLGMSLFLIGELNEAERHLRASLHLYDEATHGPLAVTFSQDFKATALAYLALTSVLLGGVDDGLRHARNAVEHAERLKHPHSICYALSFLAGASVLCRDPHGARPIADRVVALANEYAFPLWLAGGQMIVGWTKTQLGESENGIAELRSSIEALEVTGALIWVNFARYLLSQALEAAGRAEQAMEAIDRVLLQIEGTRGRWYEADLHRVRGDLLLKLDTVQAAESSYEQAIAIATRQGARLWQLRATTRLGTIWKKHGRIAEARGRIAPIRHGFRGERMIADIEEATRLLSNRRGPGRTPGGS